MGAEESHPRRVRVRFGTETYEVEIRGPPLMTDAYAVETARQVIEREEQPAEAFRTGEVIA